LPAQVRQVASLTRRIRPDKVQLNTAVRPPAEEYAMAVPPERLAKLARMFKPPAEVVAAYHGQRVAEESHASAEAILRLLSRRPCTVADISHGLGMKPAEAVKLVGDLETQGKILSKRHGLEQFYRAAAPTSGTSACGSRRRRNPRHPELP
jgi:hypothetical protein